MSLVQSVTNVPVHSLPLAGLPRMERAADFGRAGDRAFDCAPNGPRDPKYKIMLSSVLT